MKNKKIQCPICGLESEKEYGKFSCLNCNSLLEIIDNGNINLIKPNRIDIWSMIVAVSMPIIIVSLIYDNPLNMELNSKQKLVTGLCMLLYPLLGYFYMAVRSFNDDIIFGLYTKFFKGELNRQNKGKIIAFYITFITNIIGLVLIAWSILERIG